jgi:hypothetical protein
MHGKENRVEMFFWLAKTHCVREILYISIKRSVCCVIDIVRYLRILYKLFSNNEIANKIPMEICKYVEQKYKKIDDVSRNICNFAAFKYGCRQKYAIV